MELSTQMEDSLLSMGDRTWSALQPVVTAPPPPLGPVSSECASLPVIAERRYYLNLQPWAAAAADVPPSPPNSLLPFPNAPPSPPPPSPAAAEQQEEEQEVTASVPSIQTRKLLKAGGGSGGGAGAGSGTSGGLLSGEDEEDGATAQQRVQGYDVLYPSEDRGDNWAPPSKFRVDRYLNGRSRLIGGVLLTTQIGEVGSFFHSSHQLPYLPAHVYA